MALQAHHTHAKHHWNYCNHYHEYRVIKHQHLHLARHCHATSQSTPVQRSSVWLRRDTDLPRYKYCGVCRVSGSTAASTISGRTDGIFALLRELEGEHQRGALRLQPSNTDDTAVKFVAERDVRAGETILEVASTRVVTAADAHMQPQVSNIAQNCSEIVALALWLMAERALGPSSEWAAFIQTLPEATMSPLLWEEAECRDLLQGSPMLDETLARRSAISQEWAKLEEQYFSKDRRTFNEGTYSQPRFLSAFAVVLAHCAYLPAADCFALVPLATALRRTAAVGGGPEDASTPQGAQPHCRLDYRPDTGSVVLTTDTALREGDAILLGDDRPNGEMLLCCGTILDDNPSDFLPFQAELLSSDKYYSLKSQILEEANLSSPQHFPIYPDGMPFQLLNYLRMSRIQDSAALAKITFAEDRMINVMNEYEVMQLLMGECRERLAAYKRPMEEDMRAVRDLKVESKAQLAARLRLSEKRIITAMMNGVRQRLAPIRGIPTKGGKMQDPNADLKEIFDILEDIPGKSKELLDNIFGWNKDSR